MGALTQQAGGGGPTGETRSPLSRPHWELAVTPTSSNVSNHGLSLPQSKEANYNFRGSHSSLRPQAEDASGHVGDVTEGVRGAEQRYARQPLLFKRHCSGHFHQHESVQKNFKKQKN